MPRFVLLYHECPPGYERASHWDFMLEEGEQLRTWALPRLPRGWQAAQARTATFYPACPAIADENSVEAEQLPDHRLGYLHEEGPLSGNRGKISRIDSGTYVSNVELPECWELALAGKLLCGRIALRGPSERWTLSYAPAD